MGAIGNLYDAARFALAVPMTVALQFLYDQLAHLGLGSWGLTIILFTLAIRLVFWPLTIKQLKSSRAMQALQPQLNELKKLHGKDKERLMQEQMRLYRENSINPAAGCLPMLVQLPIWIGLYTALYGLQDQMTGGFLWIHSLAHPEGIPYILAILTAASQFVVQRMMQVKSDDPQQQSMNQMMQFMPLMYLFFSVNVPAGLVLYWVVSNVVMMIQQSFYTGWSSVWPFRPAEAVVAPAPRARRQPTVRPVAEISSGAVATREPTPAGAAPAAPRRAKKRRK